MFGSRFCFDMYRKYLMFKNYNCVPFILESVSFKISVCMKEMKHFSDILSLFMYILVAILSLCSSTYKL